jgi:hypothetical protein
LWKWSDRPAAINGDEAVSLDMFFVGEVAVALRRAIPLTCLTRLFAKRERGYPSATEAVAGIGVSESFNLF